MMILSMKTGDQAPRPIASPASRTHTHTHARTAPTKPKVATGALYIATVSLYVGVANKTHTCLCRWVKFVSLSLRKVATSSLVSLPTHGG
jgi:hypothetical protein